MHISSKLLGTGLLIIAVPIIVGLALTTQNLLQNAFHGFSPVTVSPTQLDPSNCPPDVNKNYQCNLTIANNTQAAIPWKVLSQGLSNIIINPLGGSLPASQSSNVTITIPISDCIPDTTKSARFQFIPGSAFATFSCLTLSSTISPTPPLINTKLTCSDCQTAGQDALCFNVREKSAYCGNGNKLLNPGVNSSLDTLCLRCPAQPTPPGICIPRPACLDATPPCVPAVPPGGWCPSGTPTPTPPPGCHYVPLPECPAPPNPIPSHYCEKLICVSDTPTLTPVPGTSCGTVTNGANGSFVTVNPPDAESCLIASYQQCNSKNLTYSINGVDTSTTHVFTISNTGGPKCSVTDQVTTNVVPVNNSTTVTYTCSAVTPYKGGALVSDCGNEGTIIVPPQF